MIIKPYIHRCVVQSGPAAGNKSTIEVDQFDFILENLCPHCEEPMVTTKALVAHIYEELTS
jgi:hypothetical protein